MLLFWMNNCTLFKINDISDARNLNRTKLGFQTFFFVEKIYVGSWKSLFYRQGKITGKFYEESRSARRLKWEDCFMNLNFWRRTSQNRVFSFRLRLQKRHSRHQLNFCCWGMCHFEKYWLLFKYWASSSVIVFNCASYPFLVVSSSCSSILFDSCSSRSSLIPERRCSSVCFSRLQLAFISAL